MRDGCPHESIAIPEGGGLNENGHSRGCGAIPAERTNIMFRHQAKGGVELCECAAQRQSAHDAKAKLHTCRRG